MKPQCNVLKLNPPLRQYPIQRIRNLRTILNHLILIPIRIATGTAPCSQIPFNHVCVLLPNIIPVFASLLLKTNSHFPDGASN